MLIEFLWVDICRAVLSFDQNGIENGLTCVTCGCSVASNWQPGRPRSDLHLNNLHHLDCC